MTVLAVIFLGHDVPNPPTDLTRNDNLTNQTQVSFTWQAPENEGKEPVLDYTVQIKSLNDKFMDLESGLTKTTFTFLSVNTGATYSFRVKARNSIGFSNYSTILSIFAATIPETPTDLVIEVA